jgi:hypothetical protein
MMKVLAKDRYESLYPDDPQAAIRNFASFMGFFGQVRYPMKLMKLKSTLTVLSGIHRRRI